MAHSDTFVLGIRDELRSAGFDVSICLNIKDDPQGDFGIAWYYGYNATTGCASMSYDVGYQPSKHTVVHEFGHDMHARHWQAQIIQQFWTLMGFNVTMDEAARQSNEYQSAGQTYAAWQRRPGEVFAETFAWTVLNDYYQTERWNVVFNEELRQRLLTFFATFKLNKEEELTPAQMAELKTYIDAAEKRIKERVAGSEINVVREIAGTVASNMRVLAAVWLQRMFYGLNPWTGKRKEIGEQPPQYTNPPAGWIDPGV